MNEQPGPGSGWVPTKHPRLSLIDLRDASQQATFALDYPAHLRLRALNNWHGRMVNEYQSHHVFSQLARRMAEAGFPGKMVRSCQTFADEERRHGVLCGAVVQALGGSAWARVEPPRALPLYDDVSPREAVARHLLSVCCLSETVAVALVGAERLQMSKGPLLHLLTEIYADEVGHARFGWRFMQEHVVSWPASAKARLSSYLRAAFQHLETRELQHISPHEQEPEAAGHELGLCNGAHARALFYDAVTQVIVPGLEAAGLGAARAWEQRAQIRAQALAKGASRI